MASDYDTEIRVTYEYIRRQRDGWHDIAPELGRIAGLLQQLQWRGEPRKNTDLGPGDWDRNLVRQLTHPNQEYPSQQDRPPGPWPAPSTVPSPWLTEWQSRQVTFLRPILDAHQAAADWAGARAVEGWTAQNNIAETLSEIVGFYETDTAHHQALLRTLR
jgi:hypothetical protein